MKKQVINCMLTAILLLALAACGRQTAQSSQTPGQTAGVQGPDNSLTDTPETTQPVKLQPGGDGAAGSVLVVYYSATGSTEAVAGYVVDALGAATFEIDPVEPYTVDDLSWMDESSRVSREHDDLSLRTVELAATTVDGWESYDTVFIGYPIWWGGAAWPMDGFVTANDFTGKTVIPFCTSSSSGLGESGRLLAEMAGTGNWVDGQRFSSGASESDVADWVEDLGLTKGA